MDTYSIASYDQEFLPMHNFCYSLASVSFMVYSVAGPLNNLFLLFLILHIISMVVEI
jgi:hypothetical protein